MTPIQRLLAGVAALALLPGCITLTWQRVRSQHTPDPGVLEQLSSPGTTLARCLDLLGAPVIVQEDRVHGLVVVYLAEDTRSFGISGSIPLGDSSASVSYTGASKSARGVALWFDADWRLARWQRGRFADLVAVVRRQSAPLDAIEEEGVSH